MTTPLAHSARHGFPVQTYEEHVANVRAGAEARARGMLEYFTPSKARLDRETLLGIVSAAAAYHDLGKLDS